MSKSPPIFPPGSDPVPVSEIPPAKPDPYAVKAKKIHERIVATYRKPKR